MSATSVRLLQVAAEIVGGTGALAARLGISESLLSRFMADRRELPDVLLLRAVDIVLGDSPSGDIVHGRAEQYLEDSLGASETNG
jgi:transcriptional regulator with XRE-family HTH domain